MTRRTVLRTVALVGALIVVATCKDSTANKPVAGWLDVRMVSPNVDDGGLAFTVGGARIDSVRTSFPVIAELITSDSLRKVVVGGNIGTGTVAQIYVPDTRHASLYYATVLEVSVRATYAQRTTAGYAAVVVAP